MITLLLRKMNPARLASLMMVSTFLASLITGCTSASSGSAHNASLSGLVVCSSDSQQQITWTLSNSSGSSSAMVVTATNPPIPGIGVGTVIASSAIGTESIPRGTNGSVQHSVSLLWSTDGFTTSVTGSVLLLGFSCGPTTAQNVSFLNLASISSAIVEDTPPAPTAVNPTSVPTSENPTSVPTSENPTSVPTSGNPTTVAPTGTPVEATATSGLPTDTPVEATATSGLPTDTLAAATATPEVPTGTLAAATSTPL